MDTLPKCKMCGEIIPPGRQICCSDTCLLEAKKYRNLSEEGKRKKDEIIKRWKLRNPEKARTVTKRANERYRRKVEMTK